MPPNGMMIANRGEIAIRVCRAVAELGWRSVVVYSEDDASSLHTRKGDTSVALGATGALAYLDIDRIIAIAVEHGCTMVHPGYGFLSEREDFAQRCKDAGLVFVGPSPDTLRAFGNKASARNSRRNATFRSRAERVCWKRRMRRWRFWPRSAATPRSC